MHEIEGFILASGASSRMGQNKTELRLGGKTFIEHAAFSLQTIAPQNVYIVGNGNIKSSGLSVLPKTGRLSKIVIFEPETPPSRIINAAPAKEPMPPPK